MCNLIALSGDVCQGFTFDSATNLAVFKGQAALQAANISRLAQPSGNTSLWWLNAGKVLNCKAFELFLQKLCTQQLWW